MLPAEKNPGRFFLWHESFGLDTGRSLRILVLTLVLAGLFFLDILTTQVVLMTGGIELNPVMAAIVSDPAHHLAVKCMILLVIFCVSLIAELQVKESSVYFYGILILLYILVVVNNVVVILPHIA
jgi:hypothetical protein